MSGRILGNLPGIGSYIQPDGIFQSTNAKTLKAKQPNFTPKGTSGVTAGEDDDVKSVLRRQLMQATSLAGLDGTDQQKTFVEKYVKSGTSYLSAAEDVTKNDGLVMTNEDIKKGTFYNYNFNAKQIAELKQLQAEYIKQGGKLHVGLDYSTDASGGDNAEVMNQRAKAAEDARRLQKLFKDAQIPPTSPFGTPSKLREMKRISIDAPKDGSPVDQTRALRLYVRDRYPQLAADARDTLVDLAKKRGVKLENINLENGKINADISVENILRLHHSYLGVQEAVNNEVEIFQQTADKSVHNQCAKGIFDGAIERVKENWHSITHPVETIRKIAEGVVLLGKLSAEIFNMPHAERAELFTSLAKAGIENLSEMSTTDAAYAIGKAIGGGAVDLALGGAVGKVFSVLKNSSTGLKLLGEAAKLGKQIKQTVGKIPIPVKVGVQVLTDSNGGRMAMPSVEVKKLEDFISAMTSVGKDGTAVRSKTKRLFSSEVADIPQGFSKIEFQKFAKSVRQLAKAAGLPEGELVIQGSRVKGTARISGRNLSDVDIALRVDEKAFFDFAQARLDSVPKDSKLYKTILKAARKGKLSRFDISKEFNQLLEKILKPNSPYKIDFSIIKVGSEYDTGPFMKIGDVK